MSLGAQAQLRDRGTSEAVGWELAPFAGFRFGGDFSVATEAQLDAQLGVPLRGTTQLPTNLEKSSSGAVLSEVIYGNWQELIIGQWGGLEFMASSETGDAFEKAQTWIRVIQEVDIALRHPESFCLVNDALTTGA